MINNFYPDRFRDKTMIITGSARGIGAATAVRAAREGAKLILCDRLEAEGSEVAADKKGRRRGHFFCS